MVVVSTRSRVKKEDDQGGGDAGGGNRAAHVLSRKRRRPCRWWDSVHVREGNPLMLLAPTTEAVDDLDVELPCPSSLRQRRQDDLEGAGCVGGGRGASLPGAGSAWWGALSGSAFQVLLRFDGRIVLMSLMQHDETYALYFPNWRCNLCFIPQLYM